MTSSGTARLQQASSPSPGWLPVGLALLLLFVPTWYKLATGFWDQDEYSHGPLILLVCLWFFHAHRHWLNISEPVPLSVPASLILAAGLLLYIVGRSQNIVPIEVLAEFPITLATLWLLTGFRNTRQLWFPITFLLFLVPIPGFIVDALTGPLKGWISDIVTHILYRLGYPITHSGVTINIGYYQLLVADACSGLNSMFSLSALGLLYMHVMQRTSVLRNTILLLTILPVAFTSNVIRVVFLVLLTYYFGDAVGQSYLHQFAGMVMFTASLLNHFMLDNLLGIPFPDHRKSTQ